MLISQQLDEIKKVKDQCFDIAAKHHGTCQGDFSNKALNAINSQEKELEKLIKVKEYFYHVTYKFCPATGCNAYEEKEHGTVEAKSAKEAIEKIEKEYQSPSNSDLFIEQIKVV